MKKWDNWESEFASAKYWSGHQIGMLYVPLTSPVVIKVHNIKIPLTSPVVIKVHNIKILLADFMVWYSSIRYSG